jgi:hypothetical protein
MTTTNTARAAETLYTILYHDGSEACSTLALASECCAADGIGADVHSTEPTDGTHDGPAIGFIAADGAVTMF